MINSGLWLLTLFEKGNLFSHTLPLDHQAMAAERKSERCTKDETTTRERAEKRLIRELLAGAG